MDLYVCLYGPQCICVWEPAVKPTAVVRVTSERACSEKDALVTLDGRRTMKKPTQLRGTNSENVLARNEPRQRDHF